MKSIATGEAGKIFRQILTSEKIVSLLVFSGILLIYSLFPTKNYYWDGIEFAQTIENARSLDSSLLQPNHLFYNAFGYIFYTTANKIGFSLRAIEVLQILNVVFGTLCAYVLFRILRALTGLFYLSIVLASMFAFSATWWKFSTDGDAYILSVLFLLTSFSLILPNRPPRPLALALAHAASMFFHQLAVFFFPVAVLGIILQTTNLDFRERLLRVLQYGATAFSLTFSVFYFCFYALTDSFDLKNFFQWVTWYSPENGFVFNARDSFFYTFRGNLRLFFDGRFNFLDRQPLIILLAIVLGVLFCALAVKLFRNRKDFKAVWNAAIERGFQKHPATLLCAAWIVSYLLFLFFFIPQNVFYRLFYLPALILLGGIFLAPYEAVNFRTRQYRTALLAAIVILANFLFFIRPFSKVRKNTPLALALEASQTWSNKTVVYYAALNSDNKLVKYFNPSTNWKMLETADTAQIENELKSIYRSGGAAWLETSAIDRISSDAKGTRWIEANAAGQARFELTDPAYRMKFVQIEPTSLEEQKPPF